MMNFILWALQVVLALKFLSVAFTHGLRPDPAKMERGNQRFGAAARPLLIGIAVGVAMCAVTLVLPAAIAAAAWLIPWAAAILAVMMLGAIGFHLACRDNPKTWVSLVLFALAAFVAYGRWVIAPL
jgi:VIT1/CCC1 family predicted Fe2+/Mn2+ transporter